MNFEPFRGHHRSAATLVVLGVFVCFGGGCQPAPAVPKEAPPTPLGAKFDPKTTGTISGRVLWSGQAPTVESPRLLVKVAGFEGEQANPNAPRIDPKTGGMDQSLVFLRKVDPAQSKPWSHPAVEVAFKNDRLIVQQGDRAGRIGIVRRGDEISCLSYEKRNHILKGRGAAFFSLPLIEIERATKRKLEQGGIVDLSSGAGFFWQRAYLWVGDHPYAVLTDDAGAFTLTDVPVGAYELVSWQPNWIIKGHERHAEFGEIERLLFADPVEQTTKILVTPGDTIPATFTWSDPKFTK